MSDHREESPVVKAKATQTSQQAANLRHVKEFSQDQQSYLHNLALTGCVSILMYNNKYYCFKLLTLGIACYAAIAN